MAIHKTSKRNISLRHRSFGISSRINSLPGRTPFSSNSIARSNGSSTSVQGRRKDKEWKEKWGLIYKQGTKMTSLIKTYPITACYVTITLLISLLLQFHGIF